MSVTTDLDADLAESIAASCARCWEAEHPPPPTSAIYLMDDWKWEFTQAARHEWDTINHALASGRIASEDIPGDLQHAAHREMYARSGDEADLARMLRHIA